MHIFSAFPSIPVPSNYPSLTFQFFSPCSVLLNCTSLQRCVPSLCNCLPCFSFSDHASPSLHSTTCSWICLVVSLCLPRPADSVHSQPADQLSVENGNDLHVPPGSWEVCQYHVSWYQLRTDFLHLSGVMQGLDIISAWRWVGHK